MKQKDNNLTQFFSEYLKFTLENEGKFNVNNITMACYGALNELDTCYNIAEVSLNMRNDMEIVLMAIEKIAKDTNKQQRIDTQNNNSAIKGDSKYTIPEIEKEYHISGQAIRKACKEGRLSYEKGYGKNKYLISKNDIMTYMVSAKGKKSVGGMVF